MALDRAAACIGNRFAGEPLLEAAVRHTIGDTYLDLGIYEKAQEQFEPAVALRTGSWGTRSRGSGQHSRPARALEQRGRDDDAARLLTLLIERLRRARGADIRER